MLISCYDDSTSALVALILTFTMAVLSLDGRECLFLRCWLLLDLRTNLPNPYTLHTKFQPDDRTSFTHADAQPEQQPRSLLSKCSCCGHMVSVLISCYDDSISPWTRMTANVRFATSFSSERILSPYEKGLPSFATPVATDKPVLPTKHFVKSKLWIVTGLAFPKFTKSNESAEQS